MQARENEGHSHAAASDRKSATRRRRRTVGLSQRELEVLRLVCEGRTSREIARDLDLSINTVFVHRANIMNVLGVHKASRLVLYALQQGLVSPPEPESNGSDQASA